MSDIKDIHFLNWYNKKDFTVLEKMKDEFHREYYCRSAWFARDEEIESQLAEKDKTIEKLRACMERIKNYEHLDFDDQGEYMQEWAEECLKARETKGEE